MEERKTFQYIVLGLFVAFIIGGVIAFSTFRSGDSVGTGDPVLIWGTLSEQVFGSFVGEISKGDDSISIIYRYIPEDQFLQEVVEKLASGTGPDVLLYPHKYLWRLSDKIVPIPYESYSARNFTESFVEEGELFLRNDGILALPISIDPLVMYWNRDIFQTAGIAEAPKFWDEFLLLTRKLTIRDDAGNITQSTVAIGEYQNITNAKEILSAMFLQGGSSIAMIAGNGNFVSTLSNSGASESVLGFYSEFANPSKSIYSWNRSLPLSKNYFISGDLAVYFGFASELSDIRTKNPNLNFSVAPFPQLRDSRIRKTFGTLYGVSLLRSSRNLEGAFATISRITSKDSLLRLSERTSVPAPHRGLLGIQADNAAAAVFAEAALQSGGWMDPDPKKTESYFATMVNAVSSGSSNLSGALSRVAQEITNAARR